MIKKFLQIKKNLAKYFQKEKTRVEGSLFKRVSNVHSMIPTDLLGGSNLDKVFIMSYCASLFKLQKYVEIGVYKGKSFFPISMVIAENGGKSYGIDPYSNTEAIEYDIEDSSLKKTINKSICEHDFNNTYNEVERFRKECKWKDSISIIRKRSVDVSHLFGDKQIDMLHIDGNHDTECVKNDFGYYINKITDGGLVIFDDIDWQSVKKIYNLAKKDMLCLMEGETFAILQKNELHEENVIDAKYLKKKLSYISTRINKSKPKIRRIAIGVLTFNHEMYIMECLNGIARQKGEFDISILISDDHSSDKTLNEIHNFIAARSNIQIKVITHQNQKQIGTYKNFWKLLSMCKGFDYVGFCEGDDYWHSDLHIANHVNFLESNPDCALTANAICWVDQAGNKLGDYCPEFTNRNPTMKDLLKDNFVGNLSSCFHRGDTINNIDMNLVNYEMGDWLFNIYAAQFGDIGYLSDLQTNYRKHDKSFWSSLDSISKHKEVIRLIDSYNKYFNYDFDAEFSDYKDRCLIKSDAGEYVENIDLMIIDDVFPHPRSGFRRAEFINYLNRYSEIKILTNGFSVSVLGNKKINEIIRTFKRENSSFASKVSVFKDFYHRKVKLAYLVFLGNAFQYIELLENNSIPFVFELYPGGSFALDTEKSDVMLKRVLNSPMFRKVIVTQKITYDYLVKNKLCSQEQIAYIFGVVSPELGILPSDQKKHFKCQKETLDICFVAHKYSTDGSDKGYDLFISAAKLLLSKHSNMQFHIVGNFDESVLDVSEIANNIKFYGSQDMTFFDTFYIDKDILLSPNRPFLLGSGFFDGFPTAAASDAGLRGTAVFCSDELNLNNGMFISGENIEIIQTDVLSIVKRIEYYFNNPDLLKNLCLQTQKRMEQIYSFESQMTPRFEVIDYFILNNS